LCTQQHEFIASQLPAIKTKLLLGSDNVDHWGEGRIWDAVLKSVRIVVSTPAILRDALTHGYVKMKSLALLVFDEGISLYPYIQTV
jgi:ERCC4-related helicase